jgi:carboxymethylenebutenolidase
VWPDIFGLRPAFRQMGKRLAESGYAVLVVNPFYRVKKAPTAVRAPRPQSGAAAARAGSERDDGDDGCEGVHRVAGPASVGSQEPEDGHAGYCMGGPIAFRTAAAVPDRVGAIASFHGGGLVTDMPNSPHLQAAKTKAQLPHRDRCER